MALADSQRGKKGGRKVFLLYGGSGRLTVKALALGENRPKDQNGPLGSSFSLKIKK